MVAVVMEPARVVDEVQRLERLQLADLSDSATAKRGEKPAKRRPDQTPPLPDHPREGAPYPGFPPTHAGYPSQPVANTPHGQTVAPRTLPPYVYSAGLPPGATGWGGVPLPGPSRPPKSPTTDSTEDTETPSRTSSSNLAAAQDGTTTSGGGKRRGGSRPQPAGLRDRTPCAFFLKTGSCAYGDRCKFDHPFDQAPQVNFNSLGLPLRPDEPVCNFFMKRYQCAFGHTCKYHHPELPPPVVAAAAAAAAVHHGSRGPRGPVVMMGPPPGPHSGLSSPPQYMTLQYSPHTGQYQQMSPMAVPIGYYPAAIVPQGMQGGDMYVRPGGPSQRQYNNPRVDERQQYRRPAGEGAPRQHNQQEYSPKPVMVFMGPRASPPVQAVPPAVVVGKELA